MSGSISVTSIVRRTFELYVRQAPLLLPAIGRPSVPPHGNGVVVASGRVLC